MSNSRRVHFDFFLLLIKNPIIIFFFLLTHFYFHYFDKGYIWIFFFQRQGPNHGHRFYERRIDSQAMLIMFQSGIKDTLIALLFCVRGVHAPLCPVLN